MTASQHSRDLWLRKPSLRAVYADLYQRIAARCVPGSVLEIGAGSGNFKAWAPAVVATDIVAAPWLDTVADAASLPFAAASFDNVVAFDALHHIEYPVLFLEEAARVLRPGGRLIVVDPAITPVSALVYRAFHPEPYDLAASPLARGLPTPNRPVDAANQAFATLLFHRQSAELAHAVPALRLTETRLLSLFAYPLSGGFRRWTLLPAAAVPVLLRCEEVLAPLLAPLMAFRLLAVLVRGGDGPG
ncbi:MAG: class I SAM-dependent methyltransferase [Alphaproteobacteria bacterium]